MKKAIIFCLVFLASASIFIEAQITKKISYQAVLRNISGQLVVNQPVGIKISLLHYSSSGTCVYEEIFIPNPLTNANGLFSIEIGGGLPLSGDFNSIDWSDGPYFLKTEMDPTGGTSYTITGVSQLLSVPYALHALVSDSVSGDIHEADPLFTVSVASGISSLDTAFWNAKIDAETDGSVTNELQDIQGVLSTGKDAGGDSLVNLGHLTVGATSTTPDAAIEINSTSSAFLPSRMTTAQRDSLIPAEGMIIYNLTERKFQGYSLIFNYLSQQLDVIQNLFNNASGSNDKSQSFTAVTTGRISCVKVMLNAAGSGGIANIKIRNGVGNGGTVLYNESVYVTYIAGGTMYSIYPDNTFVIAGMQYTINIVDNVLDPMGYGFDWLISTSNPYSGGDFYWTGMNITSYDAVFEIYVEPQTSTPGWIDLN
ncbi:MAG: hypothetical protein A2W93_09230 [Bacteroidetes bacterium GWF2_43_63]|nr:MAG: hypothetical protein A2W94_05610 [Bacteroidetes bacterium GWE2_42_42]OFY54479.1 MAG: hypothetical protein A2W93_09230 [Bacteroidetes bacterium GWF2_43_63]HBG70427.1 hypothetical protein [Bacteroidales bacterium]HCB63456.1 hypothetical protein [Bacteroidales bacterium]